MLDLSIRFVYVSHHCGKPTRAEDVKLLTCSVCEELIPPETVQVFAGDEMISETPLADIQSDHAGDIDDPAVKLT